MASNLIVARGGVQHVPPISLAFWRWAIVFLILILLNYKSILKNFKYLKKEYKKLFFLGSMGCGVCGAFPFLLHMVRNITGCLLEVGRGRLAPQDVQNLLAAKDRTLAPPTALPDGLYLAGVEYDAEHQLPPPPKLWLFPDR